MATPAAPEAVVPPPRIKPREFVDRLGRFLEKTVHPPPEALRIGAERAAKVDDGLKNVDRGIGEFSDAHKNTGDEVGKLADKATEARKTDPLEVPLAETSENISRSSPIDSSRSGRTKKERMEMERRKGRKWGILPSTTVVEVAREYVDNTPSTTQSASARLAESISKGDAQAARDYLRKVDTEAVDRTLAEVMKDTNAVLAADSATHQDELRDISVQEITDQATRAVTYELRNTERVDTALTQNADFGKVTEPMRLDLKREAVAALASRSATSEVIEVTGEIVRDYQGGVNDLRVRYEHETVEELLTHDKKIEDSSDAEVLNGHHGKFVVLDEEANNKMQLPENLLDEVMRDPQASVDRDGTIIPSTEAAEKFNSALAEKLKEPEAAQLQRRMEVAAAVASLRASFNPDTGDLENAKDAAVHAQIRTLADMVGLPLGEDTLDNDVLRRATAQSLVHIIDATGNRVFDTLQDNTQITGLMEQGYSFKLENGHVQAVKEGDVQDVGEADKLLNPETVLSRREGLVARVGVLKEMWNEGVKQDTVGVKEMWRLQMTNEAALLASTKNPTEGLSKLARRVFDIHRKYEELMGNLLRLPGGPVIEVPPGQVAAHGVPQLKEEAARVETVNKKLASGVKDAMVRRTHLVREILDRMQLESTKRALLNEFSGLTPVYKFPENIAEPEARQADLERRQREWTETAGGIIRKHTVDLVRARTRAELGKIKL